MKHYTGTLEELKKAIAAINISGAWEVNNDGKYCFRAKTGQVLNWWPSKGSINFQGKSSEKFHKDLEQSLLDELIIPETQVEPPKKIFIVHGHDQEAREQLELTLMKLGLSPFILQNVDSGSKTIIEALEQSIYSESTLGIVLMTPDDFGYTKSQTNTDRQPRARQNVILELGMVMASIGRQRTVIVKKSGPLEMPSDTMGILYCQYDKHVREIVPKLTQRLQELGFVITPAQIAYAAS